MEEEIKVSDITMSQVEAAWDTLMKVTDAIDEGIQSGDEDGGVHQMLAFMCVHHMIFSPRFNATTKVALAKLESKVKDAVSVAKPGGGINFSLMPSGEKS